ncbi:dimethylsulfonioproprionate lyase DddP [Nitratireductor sp. XY-223]|uniref:dimethylsulfonioproprionate lyase DddP n=1 Tax=Nitratireductor sp. XY-223 TaxID=2561926 RepID=UPI0010AB2060|nr:dimethylsulfonioproprionate lyase DddP [Nitratireductor sp. XY-223]
MSVFSVSNQKIDPSRRRASGLKPDGTADDNDRVEIGPTALAFAEWEAAGLTPPNLECMRQFRLDRLVAEIRKRDYAGLLCFDPLNIRYATDTTNMQLWTAHNFARACFVSADGYIVLWDFHNCDHLSAHTPLVREVRHGASFFYFESGERVEEHAAKFAAELDDLLRVHGGANRRLAVDKIETAGYAALQKLGVEIFEGQEVTELARVVKGPDEILAMRCAMHSCQAAVAEMQARMEPGITENDVWAELHAGNIRRGGEWIETRLLASGPRCNPWFQECGPRVIQQGELLAFDTDLIGTYGMCVDFSRTWMVGDFMPTNEQKDHYRVAHEHITANRELMVPGMTFEEMTLKAHRLPERFRNQRYSCLAHGVGLCDEYPAIRYPEDFEACGYGGALEPGMVMTVEAYIGADGGQVGVKLEDQLLITETGHENLTTYPFEERLLG